MGRELGFYKKPLSCRYHNSFIPRKSAAFNVSPEHRDVHRNDWSNNGGIHGIVSFCCHCMASNTHSLVGEIADFI